MTGPVLSVALRPATRRCIQETFRECGHLRARSELKVVEPLEPGESTFPLGWESKLDPGNYALVWGAPGYGLATATFAVLEGNWAMLALNSEAETAMLQLDPEVQAYTDQAREDVTAREGISADEIELLRVEAISTSAGVYRIDLGARGRIFTYRAHEDGVTFVPKSTPGDPPASHGRRGFGDDVRGVETPVGHTSS